MAEVEADENRDTNHGRAAADSVTYTAPAHSARDSPAAATEREAFRSRLGELHRAAADSVTYTAPAHSAWDSPAATATEKEAIRSRLGELRRLLNNRKGSLSDTYKKNAEANDRAYDMNQRSIQA